MLIGQMLEAPVSPAELRNLNLAHLQKVLDRTTDPQERARVETLLWEERTKPDTAYPVDVPPAGGPPTSHLEVKLTRIMSASPRSPSIF